MAATVFTHELAKTIDKEKAQSYVTRNHASFYDVPLILIKGDTWLFPDFKILAVHLKNADESRTIVKVPFICCEHCHKIYRFFSYNSETDKWKSSSTNSNLREHVCCSGAENGRKITELLKSTSGPSSMTVATVLPRKA